MTDAEKIAAIEEIFRDLAGLRKHLQTTPRSQSPVAFQPSESVAAEAAALLQVAKILGIGWP